MFYTFLLFMAVILPFFILPLCFYYFDKKKYINLHLCIFFIVLDFASVPFLCERQKEKLGAELGADENGYYKEQIGNHTFLCNFDTKNMIHDPDCQCKEDSVK